MVPQKDLKGLLQPHDKTHRRMMVEQEIIFGTFQGTAYTVITWSSIEDPVVLLERNLYGHPWQDYYGERQLEKILLKHGWEKNANWECLFVHRAKGLFLSVYVDDIKLTGKKQNINPKWKVLNKEVDLGEPTSSLDHVYPTTTTRGVTYRPTR